MRSVSAAVLAEDIYVLKLFEVVTNIQDSLVSANLARQKPFSHMDHQGRNREGSAAARVISTSDNPLNILIATILFIRAILTFRLSAR